MGYGNSYRNISPNPPEQPYMREGPGQSPPPYGYPQPPRGNPPNNPPYENMNYGYPPYMGGNSGYKGNQ